MVWILYFLLLLSRNYSVQMMLEVKPTFEFISIPHNLTYLSGSVLGSELGLKGRSILIKHWLWLWVRIKQNILPSVVCLLNRALMLLSCLGFWPARKKVPKLFTEKVSFEYAWGYFLHIGFLLVYLVLIYIILGHKFYYYADKLIYMTNVITKRRQHQWQHGFLRSNILMVLSSASLKAWHSQLSGLPQWKASLCRDFHPLWSVEGSVGMEWFYMSTGHGQRCMEAERWLRLTCDDEVKTTTIDMSRNTHDPRVEASQSYWWAVSLSVPLSIPGLLYRCWNHLSWSVNCCMLPVISRGGGKFLVERHIWCQRSRVVDCSSNEGTHDVTKEFCLHISVMEDCKPTASMMWHEEVHLLPRLLAIHLPQHKTSSLWVTVTISDVGWPFWLIALLCQWSADV